MLRTAALHRYFSSDGVEGLEKEPRNWSFEVPGKEGQVVSPDCSDEGTSPMMGTAHLQAFTPDART